MELGASAVPSWSWFGLPIYTTQSFDNYHKDEMSSGVETKNYQVIFKATLAQVHRSGPLQTSRKKSAFHDFIDLKLSLNLATFNTTLKRRARQSQMWETKYIPRQDYPIALDCTSLREQLRSVYYKHGMGHLIRTYYYCDDPDDIETPPDNILLALLLEETLPCLPSETWEWDADPTEEIHWLSGLGLQPGKGRDTWKRHGYWEAYVIQSQKDYEEVDTSNQFWYPPQWKKPGDWDVQEPGREEDSVFLHLEGVKREALTLV
jgi:hypothetical protein